MWHQTFAVSRLGTPHAAHAPDCLERAPVNTRTTRARRRPAPRQTGFARGAQAVLACAMVLALPAYGGTQAPPDNTALAVPVSGRIVITDMGKAETHIVPTPVVATGSTSQREDLDVTLPVLGLPLRGPASLMMEAHMTLVVVSATTTAQGKADRVVLRGPAGDAIVSLLINQPVHGMGGYDPAEATVHIRGTGGTGMFEGVRIQADLKGAFKPAGTLYLGYPSADAALAAARRGLAQNPALTDPERAAFLAQVRQAVATATVDIFPPEESAGPAGRPGPIPAKAVVTSAVRPAGPQTQLIVRIVVPQGDAHQTVEVLAVQPDGSRRTIYHADHAPGDVVSTSASGTPPFVVLVYVAGAMVRQITVPAP